MIELLEILKDANLESMTTKKVRLQMEKDFDCKFVSRKKEIDNMVVEYINSKVKVEEEDEEEDSDDEPIASPPKKQKRKKSDTSESEEEISSDDDKPRKKRAAAPAKKAPRKKAEGSGKGRSCIFICEMLLLTLNRFKVLMVGLEPMQNKIIS